ncbi:MAG: protein kinase, partial [Nitrososphaerales archaeon]
SHDTVMPDWLNISTAVKFDLIHTPESAIYELTTALTSFNDQLYVAKSIANQMLSVAIYTTNSTNNSFFPIPVAKTSIPGIPGSSELVKAIHISDYIIYIRTNERLLTLTTKSSQDVQEIVSLGEFLIPGIGKTRATAGLALSGDHVFITGLGGDSDVVIIDKKNLTLKGNFTADSENRGALDIVIDENEMYVAGLDALHSVNAADREHSKLIKSYPYHNINIKSVNSVNLALSKKQLYVLYTEYNYYHKLEAPHSFNFGVVALDISQPDNLTLTAHFKGTLATDMECNDFSPTAAGFGISISGNTALVGLYSHVFLFDISNRKHIRLIGHYVFDDSNSCVVDVELSKSGNQAYVAAGSNNFHVFATKETQITISGTPPRTDLFRNYLIEITALDPNGNAGIAKFNLREIPNFRMITLGAVGLLILGMATTGIVVKKNLNKRTLKMKELEDLINQYEKQSVPVRNNLDGLVLHPLSEEDYQLSQSPSAIVSLRDCRQLALKQLKFPDDMPQEEIKLRKEKFMKELDMMSSLKHHKIVKCYGTHGNFSIAMEYMSEGSLYKLLSKHTLKEKFSSNSSIVQISIALDIAEALEYMHVTRNIIHGDIKSQNVLLTISGGNQVIAKLADFDFSRDANSKAVNNSFGRAGPWIAPELFPALLNQKLIVQNTKASDIYSLGKVFLEIATEKTPPSIPLKIDSDIANLTNSNCDQQLQNLIRSCLETDPNQRPEIVEITCKLKKLKNDLTPTPSQNTAWSSCLTFWSTPSNTTDPARAVLLHDSPARTHTM